MILRVRLKRSEPVELVEAACVGGCGRPQRVVKGDRGTTPICHRCLARHERETGDAAARQYLQEVARAS